MKCILLVTGLLALPPVIPLWAQESPASDPIVTPRLEVQSEDVLTTEIKPLGDRQLIVQKLAPFELPPLPPASPGTAAVPLPQKPQAAEKPVCVFVSATVHLFRQQPDQPRTLVRFWFTPESTPVTVWTNANFLWLLGSFGSVEADGQRFNLLPTVTTEQWERPGATVMRHGQPYQAPEIPVFADESLASFVVAEGSPSEEELAPLRALLAHYNASRAQLRADYEARTALAAEQARERAANPPEKKTLVLKYWRMDPAGQAGGNSQPSIDQ